MLLSVLALVWFYKTNVFNAYASIEDDVVGAYSGSASVEINNNKPMFNNEDITTVSYEKYGDLDNLGRCTIAMACIGMDLMPTEERGSIGMIKPIGWNQNKYPDIVDSDPPYLYNRCHMIGFQLTGENANEKKSYYGHEIHECRGYATI